MLNGKFLAIVLSGIICATYFSMSLCVKEIKKEKEFYKKLERAPFSFVMLYKHKKNSPVWERNLALQKENFFYVSNVELYRNGDVQFLALDLDRKHLFDIAQRYQVSALPSFLLFKYGRVVKDKDAHVAMLSSFAKQKDLINFINRYLRNQIERYIERMAEIKAEQRELADASANLFVAPVIYTPGVVNPYDLYYDPWYYGGPYFPACGGVGVNFGVNVGF